MDVVVRRIRPGEGAVLRGLRLRALRDSPGVFATTYDDEAARPPSVWEQAATARSTGAREASFVAFAGERAVGLVGGFVSPAQAGIVHLVSMWVEPGQRGRGIGNLLVDEVVAWSKEVGAERIDLWVVVGNDRAASLYRRAGFEETSDRQPLPSDPALPEVRMALAIAAGPG